MIRASSNLLVGFAVLLWAGACQPDTGRMIAANVPSSAPWVAIAVGDMSKPNYYSGIRALENAGIQLAVARDQRLVIVPPEDVERAQKILARDEFKDAFSNDLPNMTPTTQEVINELVSHLPAGKGG
jgi:hypothetical protein